MKILRNHSNIYISIILGNIIFAIVCIILGKYYSAQYHRVWSFDVLLNITFGTSFGIMNYRNSLRELRGYKFNRKKELLDFVVLLIFGIIVYVILSYGIRFIGNHFGIEIPTKFILSK